VNTIENRILSPTAINTYLFCPQKFYFRYIQKLKTKPSIHLVRGQIVHQTIYRFHRKPAARGASIQAEKAKNDLLGIFDQEWEKATNTIESLPLTLPEIAFYHDESEHMLRNFAQWYSQNRMLPSSSETKMLSWNLRLMGIIDAVHHIGDRVVLVDYKTSKYPKITDDIRRQAALYALLCEDQHGITPSEVRIHFLVQAEDPTSIRVDEDLLTYAKETLRLVAQKTSTTLQQNYPCTCGGLCKKDFL